MVTSYDYFLPLHPTVTCDGYMRRLHPAVILRLRPMVTSYEYILPLCPAVTFDGYMRRLRFVDTSYGYFLRPHYIVKSNGYVLRLHSIIISYNPILRLHPTVTSYRYILPVMSYGYTSYGYVLRWHFTDTSNGYMRFLHAGSFQIRPLPGFNFHHPLPYNIRTSHWKPFRQAKIRLLLNPGIFFAPPRLPPHIVERLDNKLP